ncbi:MAG: S8 family serine peptidase [Chloroflexia bacterium]
MLSFLPPIIESNETPPDLLMGYASVRSLGGTSVFASTSLPTSADPYHSTAADRQQARRELESAGCTVVSESQLGFAFAAPRLAFETLTNGQIVTRERLMHCEAGRARYVTHFDITGTDQPHALGLGVVPSTNSRIEGIVIERPRIPAAVFPSPIPPPVGAFHLRVPDDVALVLGARKAHQHGHTGSGVTVAMIDSGQYAHPFFLARHYAVRPTHAMVPGTSPAKDPVGHGTGESANIFAAAPGATLQPIRVSDPGGHLIGVMAGLLDAKSTVPKPRIITNSWGGDEPLPAAAHPPAEEQALVAEVLDAIAQGIIVVFSAGNGQFAVEPQIPGVIAAGGVYLTPQHTLRASDYASGYHSPWFGGVNVPTVSGLVGLRPRAQYLLLPVPPTCEIDVDESQPDDGAPGDGTFANDGWALFSGTSAAAPQIAGVCALILGVRPHLTRAQLRQCLVNTATDVIVGRCHPRFDNLAVTGPDLATGAGLVNASAAVDYALANFPNSQQWPPLWHEPPLTPRRSHHHAQADADGPSGLSASLVSPTTRSTPLPLAMRSHP